MTPVLIVGMWGPFVWKASSFSGGIWGTISLGLLSWVWIDEQVGLSIAAPRLQTSISYQSIQGIQAGGTWSQSHSSSWGQSSSGL